MRNGEKGTMGCGGILGTSVNSAGVVEPSGPATVGKVQKTSREAFPGRPFVVAIVPGGGREGTNKTLVASMALACARKSNCATTHWWGQ